MWRCLLSCRVVLEASALGLLSVHPPGISDASQQEMEVDETSEGLPLCYGTTHALVI